MAAQHSQREKEPLKPSSNQKFHYQNHFHRIPAGRSKIQHRRYIYSDNDREESTLDHKYRQQAPTRGKASPETLHRQLQLRQPVRQLQQDRRGANGVGFRGRSGTVFHRHRQVRGHPAAGQYLYGAQ